MLRLLGIAWLLAVSNEAVSQSSDLITEDQAVATLGKVWGFLKYYHPRVASRRLDWEQELVAALPKVQQHHSKEELSQFLLTVIDKLGPVDRCKKCVGVDSVRFSSNLDLAWLDDSTTLTFQLSQQLRYIAANRNQGKNHYVNWNSLRNRLEFNEERYSRMALPNQTYRLVGLLRCWNVIQYFHPSKYLIGRDWKEVLIEFIPRFREAADTLAYQLVMRQLIGTIQDGHAELFIPNDFRITPTGPWFVPPFYYQIVQDTVLVTGFYHDSLSRLNDVQRGDRIVGIDGKPVSQFIDARSIYTSASNQAARNQQLSSALLAGLTPSIALQIVRRGLVVEKTVQRYTFQTFGYRYPTKPTSPTKVIPDDVGYVDVGRLKVSDVGRVMKRFKFTKGIIFDVRGYPKGTFRRLSKYLNPYPVGFARYTKPDLSFPGTFNFGPVQYVGHGKRTDYYRGKVAILCNSHTQSAAESTCTALRTAPNAKIIGSQSAGANGDVSYFSFPGNYRTRFTGIGVYTLNGRPVQRSGVSIDVEVEPSCDDVLTGEDRVLETALQWINQ